MYNERQKRFSRAFVHASTLCSIRCRCGRVHFTSAVGHGDYDDGELEALQRKAAAFPDKYCETSAYDHIEWAMVNGEQVVPDCPCGYAERIAKFAEDHAHDLCQYLRLYFDDRGSDRGRESERDAKAVEQISFSHE